MGDPDSQSGGDSNFRDATQGTAGAECAASDDGPSCGPGEDAYYGHPLQGVALVDGQIPFLDRRVSPAGNVYALMEGGHGMEDETYVDFGPSLLELDRREYSAAERAEVEATRPDVSGEYVHDTIGASLHDVVDAALAESSDALIPVHVLVRRSWAETVTLRIWRAVAEGEIETMSDREAVRQQIMQDVATETSATMTPVVTFLAERGVSPEFVGTHTTSLLAEAPASVIVDLAARPDVVRIDLLTGSSAIGGAHGQEEADALQHRLFWDESYTCGTQTCNLDGENGTAPDIHVAVVDAHKLLDTHVAFRESSGSTTRITSLYDCSGTCAGVSHGTWNPGASASHGTSVMGALLADYRDGQDSGVTGTAAREQRSAAAGEARGYFYWVDSFTNDFPKVADHVVGVVPAPRIIVASGGDADGSGDGVPATNDFSDCNGDTAYDGEVDQLFENGIAYFSLAGNDLDDPTVAQDWDDDGIGGTSTNCTLWDPASAVSAFTVAAFDPEEGAPCDMRNSSIEAESSWGGATSNFGEGRYRTAVDVMANWGGDATPSSGSTTSTTTFVGTSNAAPTAASGAVAFIDMMKNIRGSTLIDDPGMLLAWMLNNADRTTGGFSYLTSGYDSRAGAGRLALRYITAPGMDSPWYWYHWELCVDHNETVTLPIVGGNVLPSDVDSFRATAWWYDRRFNGGTALDNINLYLRETDDTLLRSSQHFFDNKERVFYSDVGGLAVKLDLVGYAVTSDNEGCGTNSMRVWVTVLIEDNDRDDADGPSYTNVGPDACIGVKQL